MLASSRCLTSFFVPRASTTTTRYFSSLWLLVRSRREKGVEAGQSRYHTTGCSCMAAGKMSKSGGGRSIPHLERTAGEPREKVSFFFFFFCSSSSWVLLPHPSSRYLRSPWILVVFRYLLVWLCDPGCSSRSTQNKRITAVPLVSLGDDIIL